MIMNKRECMFALGILTRYEDKRRGLHIIEIDTNLKI